MGIHIKPPENEELHTLPQEGDTIFGVLIDGAFITVAIIMLVASIAGFLLTGRPRPRVLLLFILCILTWIGGFWMTFSSHRPVHTALWQFISLGAMVLTICSSVIVLTEIAGQKEDR